MQMSSSNIEMIYTAMKDMEYYTHVQYVDCLDQPVS